jgi:hypothetical protein
VKKAAADFHFPLLGFTPDGEIWGFPDIDTLTSCGPRTLKENMQTGMELVDVDGRRWIVRSVRRVGRARPLVPWLVSALLTSAPQSRIEHEVEQLGAITLSEAQARACAALRAFPQDYGAEDKDDPVLKQRLAEVTGTRTIAAIHDVLGLDSFMAY